MSSPKSSLLYERYELKYHIPFYLIEEISDYISGFCELDHYSLTSPDKFYTINNLYLDTPTHLFFRMRQAGMDERFNMRIRTYGDEEMKLWFFEVKHKTRGFVRKTRAKITDPVWFNYLKEGTWPETNWALARTDYAHQFISRALSYQAAPVVFTQYRRKAYFSTIDDYARVTFDINLRYVGRNQYTFERQGLRGYDHQAYFAPYTDVVLELKCEAKAPWWMLDLIRRFNLQRANFSKFAFAVNESMHERLQIDRYFMRAPA